jgi:hypothetical protein
VGDLFMTLIHTCQLCGANSFDYLTKLQRHAPELVAKPAEWMPWNYSQLAHGAALHRQSLLVIGRDAGIQTRPEHFRRFPWLAKNVFGFCLWRGPFYGHFRASPHPICRTARLDHCDASSLGFVSLTEALDLTTPAGRAMAGLLAIFAEFEREILRERTKAGLAHARQNGKRLGCPATAVKHAAEVWNLHRASISKSEIALETRLRLPIECTRPRSRRTVKGAGTRNHRRRFGSSANIGQFRGQRPLGQGPCAPVDGSTIVGPMEESPNIIPKPSHRFAPANPRPATEHWDRDRGS